MKHVFFVIEVDIWEEDLKFKEPIILFTRVFISKLLDISFRVIGMTHNGGRASYYAPRFFQ